MADSKSLVGCLFCRLPAEVWQQIAGLMTMREWAQISGVCKRMWRVPLLKVKMTPEGQWEYPEAALLWAAQRAKHIRVLVYDAASVREAASSDAATHALTQICNQAASVQEVLIHAENYIGPELQRVEDMASAVTPQLAASAFQLKALKCQFGKLASFPCMLTLKHLVIQVRYDTFRDGLGALTALQQLETLHIKGEPSGVTEWSLSDHFDCPLLDLTSLRCLRSFSLGGFTAKGILVSSGCYVHVTMCCTEDHLVWGSLSHLHSEGSLRSIQWSNSDVELILAPRKIPRMIRESWQLQRVSLHSLDWKLGNLSAALASVRVLCIKGHDVVFRVPALVKWHEFTVSADDQLAITFENVLSFAHTPLSFCFDCIGGDHKFGREWLPFNTAMLQSKPNWVCLKSELRRGTCDYISYGRFHHECICGACLDCLRAAGKVHDA